MRIRTLIVDDEPLARERVRLLLAEEPDVEILAECANGPEAIDAIEARRPDLVFLDIQMPEVSGFDVLRALPPDTWPLVIFVTAHDRHAIEAFEIRALDYLLKPFKRARFRLALARAREHLESRTTAGLNARLRELLESTPTEPAYLSRLAVKTGDRTLFVKVEDIDFIESAANYAVLHTAKENHVVRETLTNLEARLSPKHFLRISRSTMVNLDRVRELQPLSPGEHVLVLTDGRKLTVTRGLREVQERLQFT